MGPTRKEEGRAVLLAWLVWPAFPVPHSMPTGSVTSSIGLHWGLAQLEPAVDMCVWGGGGVGVSAGSPRGVRRLPLTAMGLG